MRWPALLVASQIVAAALGDTLPVRVSVKSAGSPLPDAYVAFVAHDQPWDRPTVETVLPDASATLRVPAGEFEVLVAAKGHQGDVKRVRVARDARNELAFDLAPDVSVAGTVSDAAGNPVAGATVRHVRIPLSELATKHAGTSWTTRTDENGWWSLTMPTTLAMPLLIEAPGYAPSYQVWRPTTRGELRTVLAKGASLRIELDRVDPNVEVRLSRPSPAENDVQPQWQAQIWSRRATSRTIEWQSLAPGTYRVIAAHADPARFVAKSDLGAIVVAPGENQAARTLPATVTPSSSARWLTAVDVREATDAFMRATNGTPRRVQFNVQRVAGGFLLHFETALTNESYVALADRLLVAREETAAGPFLRAASFKRGDATLRISPEGETPLPRGGSAVFRDCENGTRVELPIAVGANGEVEFPAVAGCRAIILRFDPLEPVALTRTIQTGEKAALGSFTLAGAASAEVRVVREQNQSVIPGAQVRVVIDSRTGPEQFIAEAIAGDDGRAIVSPLPADEPLIFEARVPATTLTGAVAATLTAGERKLIDPLPVPEPATLIVDATLSEKFRSRYANALITHIMVRGGADIVPGTTHTVEAIGAPRTFEGLRPGVWHISAVVSAQGNIQPLAIGDVELRSSEVRRFSAQVEPLVFRGMVTHNGAPAEAQLQIWTEIGGRPAKSGSTGEFEVILPETGTYLVSGVVRDGRELIQLGAVDFVQPGVPVQIAFPDASLDVIVTDHGEPVADAQVTVMLQLEGPSHRIAGTPRAKKTSADGKVSFQSLLPRQWLIEARDARTGRTSSKVVAVRDRARAVLELGDSAVFGGTIATSSGAPIASARIECLYLGGDEFPRFGTTRSDDRGQFTMTLAAAPNTPLRCGVIAPNGAVTTFSSTLTRTAAVTVPSSASGTLTVRNWKQHEFRDSRWLANSAGQVFNLSWAAARNSGGHPMQLTIAGLAEGRWQLLEAASMRDWVALARGTTTGLKTISDAEITAGKAVEINMEEHASRGSRR